MSTLYAAILGFLASQVSVVWELLRERWTFKRELEDAKWKLEAAEKGLVVAQQSFTSSDVALSKERAVLAEEDKSSCLNCIRAAVRPVLTFGFFALFVYVTVTTLLYGIAQGVEPSKLYLIVWGVESTSLFAGIVGYWFGSRNVQNAYAQRRVISMQEPRGTGLNGIQIRDR